MRRLPEPPRTSPHFLAPPRTSPHFLRTSPHLPAPSRRRYGFAQSASVFNAFYNDTGLFGVYGAAPAENMGMLVAALCDEMKKMSGNISDLELSRAKNQLKSSLLMNLESRPILFEDIGRQVLTYGARTPASELVQQIESVTAADLNKVATKLLSTPPSVVVYGDTTCVPRYDVISRQFA